MVYTIFISHVLFSLPCQLSSHQCGRELDLRTERGDSNDRRCLELTLLHQRASGTCKPSLTGRCQLACVFLCVCLSRRQFYKKKKKGLPNGLQISNSKHLESLIDLIYNEYIMNIEVSGVSDRCLFVFTSLYIYVQHIFIFYLPYLTCQVSKVTILSCLASSTNYSNNS